MKVRTASLAISCLLFGPALPIATAAALNETEIVDGVEARVSEAKWMAAGKSKNGLKIEDASGCEVGKDGYLT